MYLTHLAHLIAHKLLDLNTGGPVVFVKNYEADKLKFSKLTFPISNYFDILTSNMINYYKRSKGLNTKA